MPAWVVCMKHTSRHRLPTEKAAIIRTSPPAVMTLLEAAAYLSCSPRYLRDLIKSGKVRSARIGLKIIFRREWLDAVIG